MAPSGITLTIRSQQIYEGEKTPILTQTAQGSLLPVAEEGYVVSYEEPADSGMENCLTTLRVEKTSVTMERQGQFATRMVFRVGTPFETTAHTPYGELPMVVTTTHLHTDTTQGGRHLTLQYTISINGSLLSKNFLSIHMEPAEERRKPQ